MNILLYAKDLWSAKRLLQTSVRGYKRRRPYTIIELDFKEFYNLSVIEQNYLMESGYFYLDRC